MHGNDGEDWKRKRHMWPVSPHAATVASSSPSDETHFCKDGRKISVGDCALFQAEGSPPFIGIIRWLTTTKEEHPKLGVNWLYRPSDVKLGKGILFDAAPNEVFYSFHKDEISAAFLLHPCKVAFLRKGVELPPGISSFVCRRVYDTADKCLWWLTDKDYINEWQEEVNQLLDRTRLEMYAEGQSPKPLNSPTSSQQLKSGSDSVPNSAALFSPQVKGKKRERGAQGSEPFKRDRSSKTDEGEGGHGRSESMIKSDVAKITDKEGGLVNLDGVEKLVQLMQSNRPERKIDLAGRVMLADAIAATERFDFLGKFVQLRGLSVLDDWLQEAHKGKVGDSGSPKEGDKGVEELLLSLLRALDKLPVNLHALQSCNIGKSVNHLRSHKNLEIHKKAKSLVDTWKKRVDAEMKSNDAKSGSSQAASWPGKSSFAEVSYSGSKRSGSSDVLKGPILQPAATKTASSKLAHGDSGGKLGSLSPNSAKLSVPASTTGTKDSYAKIAVTSGTSDAVTSGTSDLPLPVIKEEKSSSSSQSQNNSQSCSSDHAKVSGSAWKEDARSSTAISMTRTTGSSSRHRKSSNGYLGSGGSGIHKESFGGGKLGSMSRNVISDKISQVGATDALLGDNGNNQRLIVRLPNPDRSPARSVSGGSLEDIAVIGSQASSLGVSDRHDLGDRKLKGKGGASQGIIAPEVNNESWQSNNMRDGVSEVDEGDRSLVAALDEEQSRNSEDVGKSLDVPKTTYLSAGNDTRIFTPEVKYTKSYDVSFNPMNALIESCVEYSETPPSLSGADELGMNLLASVAADEISKSGLVSPSASPARGSPLQEDSNNEKDSKSRFSRDNLNTQEQGRQGDPRHDSHEKQGADVCSKDREGHQVIDDASQSVADCKPSNDKNEKPLGSGELHQPEELSVKSEGKPSDGSPAESNGIPCHESPASMATELPMIEEHKHDPCNRKRSNIKEDMDGFVYLTKKPKSPSPFEKINVDPVHEKVMSSSMTMPAIQNHPLCDGSKVVDNTSSRVVKKDTMKKSFSSPVEADGKGHVRVEGSVGESSNEEEKPPTAASTVVSENGRADTGSLPCSIPAACSDGFDILKSESAKSLEGESVQELNSSEKVDQACGQLDRVGDKNEAMVCESAVVKQNTNGEGVMEKNVMADHQFDLAASGDKSSLAPVQESEEVPIKSVRDVCVESESVAEISCTESVGAADTAPKLEFDLNEGFPTDNGNQDDPAYMVPLGSNVVIQPSALPFSVTTITNGITNGIAASITVAAAAKGPFVPPDNIMCNKRDTHWKGSAARSAFRRAEPRRVQEPPSPMYEVLSADASLSKQGCPLLDIDLNVADERVGEDELSQSSSVQLLGSEPDVKIVTGEILCSTSGRSAVPLDLDLNRAEEGSEAVGTSRRLEIPFLSTRPSSSSGGLSSGEQAPRNFDLNNGPVFDEVGTDSAFHYAHAKSNGPYGPSIANLRTSIDLRNLSSWFPAGSSYSQLSLPPFVPDRMEQPYPIVATPSGVQRILGSSSGGPVAYSADMYRTPVLSSSPAISFPSTNAFPYASLPFGGGFPLTSTSFTAGSTYMETSFGAGPCFPAVPSQLGGPTATVSTPYVRPYLISHPDGPGVDASRMWPRQGLDLNTGPGSIDTDARDERFNAVRQLSIVNPQALTEEQVKMFQVAGAAALKRKEPEGGWDAERFGYKQPSWQ